MQRINLLFVITKLELGGAQLQLLELVKRLDKNRYNIFIFTAKEGLLVSDIAKLEGINFRRSYFLERKINPFKDFFAFLELIFFIKSKKIDIIHTHSSKAGVLGRFAGYLAGTKLIIHSVHGWSFNGFQNSAFRKIFVFLERLAAKVSDKIIIVSLFDKEKGLKLKIGEPQKYALIRYGIDRSLFRRTEKKGEFSQSIGLGEKGILITNISCFKPQKSCLDFVRLTDMISRNLPDKEIRFLLVGDGILRKEIEKTIGKLGLKEKFTVAGWRRDIPAILSMTDIFVLTSLWEGLPISAIEAIASSCPVVATQTGGIEEVISDGSNGFLVEPGNVGQMYDKILPLIEHLSFRRKIGEAALASLSEEFLVEKMAFSMQRLYEENFIYAG